MSSTGLMRIGMASLLLGYLVHYFIRPSALLGQDLADGAFGVLLGVAIATLLLSVRRGGRQCSRG
jgi:hypothetical protein